MTEDQFLSLIPFVWVGVGALFALAGAVMLARRLGFRRRAVPLWGEVLRRIPVTRRRADGPMEVSWHLVLGFADAGGTPREAATLEHDRRYDLTPGTRTRVLHDPSRDWVMLAEGWAWARMPACLGVLGVGAVALGLLLRGWLA